MKRYSKLIPQGTRDLLFEECDDRRNVEAILSALFKEHKYRKVMTPTVEFYDVFAENDLGIEAEEMYKLSDSQGRTTVLRPDNTAPIARLVATRLSKEDFPVRLYYNQNVYVRNKSLAGRTDETEQSGIELIGDGSMLILKLFLWLMRHLREITFPHLNLNFAMRDFLNQFLIK